MSEREKKSDFFGGYTIVELLVSMSIIMIMLSVVLANFRAGGRTNEISMILRQITNAVNNIRNQAMAGKIDNTGNYPAGGYLIRFEYDLPSRYFFATSSLPFVSSAAARYQPNNELPNSFSEITGYRFVEFCGLDNLQIDPAVTDVPCRGAQWKKIKWSEPGDFLEIGFNQPSGVIVNYRNFDPNIDNFKYIGGVVTNERSNQKFYFYVSLVSGLVGGSRQ